MKRGLLLVMGIAFAFPLAAQRQGALRIGVRAVRALPPAGTHTWTLDLRANQYVTLRVLQNEVDAVVRIVAPTGQQVLEVDNNGVAETDTAAWITEMGGRWRIMLAPFDSTKSGRYEVVVDVARTPTREDRERMAVRAAHDSAMILQRAGFAEYQQGTAESTRSAIATWQRARVFALRSNDARTDGRMLNGIGAFYQALGRLDSALVYLGRALVVRRQVADRSGEAETLGNLGTVLLDVGKPDSALFYLTAALGMHRELHDTASEAWVLTSIAHVNLQRGSLDSALVQYRSSLLLRRAANDSVGEGVTLESIGTVFGDRGETDSALAYMHAALPIHRRVGNRMGETSALLNIGTVYDDLSYPDSALLYLRQSLEVARETGNRNGEGTALARIGRIWGLLGRSADQLAALRDALVIKRETGDRLGEGTTLSAIGSAYSSLGMGDSALASFRRAIDIHVETGDRASEAATIGNIGQVYEARGALDSALVYFRRGWKLNDSLGLPLSASAGLQRIGRTYRDLGQPDTALVYLTRALRLVRTTGNKAGEGVVLADIATIHNRRPKGLATARAYYDSAAAARAAVRRHGGSDPARLSFAEQDVKLFAAWTLAWLAPAGRRTSRPDAFAALGASERGRAQALLDLVGTAPTGPGSWNAAGEGERLATVAVRNGTAALVYLITADTLVTWFIRSPNEIAVARRPVRRDSLVALVDSLRRTLGADEAGSRRVALRGGGSLERGLGVARGRDTSSFDNAARRLAELLLPPDLDRKLPAGRELIVVPHGPLGLLPFAALPLRTQRGGALGTRYALRYAPSLATLEATENRAERLQADNRSETLAHALLVGNPAMPRRTRLGEELTLEPLPGAETEARWIAEKSGASVLSGAAATETGVRRRLASAPLVHLATHGYVYSTEARVRESFIVLAPDSTQDGFLTVGEILDDPTLSLTADLVVLSACQTGLGDLKQAEGTVGLQRAFLSKGARSVLVSLWSVSDEATSLLMQRFYTHWLDDADHPSKAEALRRAQEEVRARQEFRDPMYWAAFQLVGAR